MTARSRIAVAVALTLLIVGTASILLTLRIRSALRRGTLSMSYVENAGPKQPKVFGYAPGQVMLVFPDGTAAAAGIRTGDEIVAINGFAITDHAGLARVDQAATTGSLLTYRIKRAGKTFDVPVRVGEACKHPIPNIYLGLVLFVALSFIVTGLVVFSRKPDDRRVVVFFAMMLGGAAALMASGSMTVDNEGLRGIYVGPSASFGPIVLWAVFSMAFAPLALHMALIFPQDRLVLRRHPRVLRLVYAFPVIAASLLAFISFMTILVRIRPASSRALNWVVDLCLAIIATAGLLLLIPVLREAKAKGIRAAMWNRPLQSLAALFAILTGLVAIFVAFKWKIPAIVGALLAMGLPFAVLFTYPIWTCVSLYRSYREAGLEERRQVQWPLWGILIAFSIKIVITVGLQIFTGLMLYGGYDMGSWMYSNFVVQMIPVAAYLLIPISFAFAILKYRLMNIDVIIKKTVAYAILSGAVIFLYLVLVGGLGTLLIKVAGVTNTTTVMAATLVVAVVFVPLRNKLQHLVDRNLFRQKFDYPQALRAISTDTVGAVSLGPYLASITEKIQQPLQNRAVVLYLRRESDLIASAKVGVPDSVIGTRISSATADSIDRPLDPRRRPFSEQDAGELRRQHVSLLVPVRSHGTVAALIALAPKLSDQEFDLEDIEFVSSAADQLAIGIDRIRLQHEEVDFEQARTMQQSLLPAESPDVAGLDVAGIWQPARAVGGDYYDLLKLSDTKLAVCIGDVAGKGMPAALLMSALQAAVRASATEDEKPSEVVKRVRRVVVPSLSGRFVTFFYCVIDTAAKKIHYCNAGHNQPVIVRADGTSVRLTESSPVLSRLFKDSPLVDGEAELQPGDRLVLFTDGVSEARDASETDFGEQRLEELVTAHRHAGARELATMIASTVSSFSGGKADDDLTLVAIAVS